MHYTDDPLADFLRHDTEDQMWLERQPRCAECGEHIQQEYAVHIGDHYYCDGCLLDLRERIGDD